MSTDLPPLKPPRIPLPVVRLEANTTEGGSGETAVAHIQVSMGDQPVRFEISVPARPTHPQELLPIFQGLTDAVVGVAVQSVERQGQQISCRKGCGACCRQVVPVSESEARAIKRLVDAMPEPHRSRVRERFGQALDRFAQAGLLEQLRRPEPTMSRQLLSLGPAYFKLGVPCPFLEQESCSIHPDRPLACREYLVTSPREACANPTDDTVKKVPLPARVGRVLRTLDKQAWASSADWVPLILALEWADEHPEPPVTRHGPKLLEESFAMLAKGMPAAGGSRIVADWIMDHNLGPFLTVLGWIIGHGFTEDDKSAVSRGVGESDYAANQWYERECSGQLGTRLRLARDHTSHAVRIWIDVSAEVEAQVWLAVTIFQQFQVECRSAFPG